MVSFNSQPDSKEFHAAGAATSSVAGMNSAAAAAGLTQSDAHVIRLSHSLDKTKDFSDYELSFHFGVLSDGDGKDAKGVFPNESRIDQDTDQILPFMKGDYLIFARTKAGTQQIDECVIIKKGPQPNSLQYFDQKSQTFKALTKEILGAFKFTSEDRCVQVGIGTENPKYYIYANPTTRSEFPPLSNKKFYQERQSGLLCGYHAINAFYGDRTCSLTDYGFRSSRLYQEKLGLPAETTQAILSDDEMSPLESTDAGILHPLIISLAKDGLIPAEYQHIKLALLSDVKDRSKLKDMPQWKAISADLSHPAVDRVVVGWGADHFLALRKNGEGKWHVIDSQKNDSQDKSYSSIEECLSTYERGAGLAPENFSLIYNPPPAQSATSSEAISKLAQSGIKQAVEGSTSDAAAAAAPNSGPAAIAAVTPNTGDPTKALSEK